MAPRSYNPYRKCDFCKASNYPSNTSSWPQHGRTPAGRRTGPSFSIAWTLHHHSNKMTCPNCKTKGMEAERLAIAEVIRHRVAMEGIGCRGSAGGSEVVGCLASDAVYDAGSDQSDNRQPTTDNCTAEPPEPYSKARPARAVVEQYNRIKEQHRDALLLFREGDQYWALQEDATALENLLGCTGSLSWIGEDLVRIARFPATSLEVYLPQLVKKHNRRVAICDRIEQEGSELDDRLLRPEDGPRSDVMEPAGKYETSGERFTRIEKGKVLARLEDIAGVLRRHNALKDAPALAKYMDDIRESVANDNLMADIDKVRQELSLRSVWISHQGRIICRIDGCWMKFQAGMVLDFISEAKSVYSGKQMSEGAPKLGAARMRFDDEELLGLAEHNARVAAKSGSPALKKYFDELLRKAMEAFGVSNKQAA